MTANEFIRKLKMTAQLKTVYVLGGWGVRLTEEGKIRAINSYPYNSDEARKTEIMNCDENSFGFDCSGLIKGILWGFSGTKSTNGGAIYKANGVPDANAKGLIELCDEVNVCTSARNIAPGSMLWMDGHCGVYVGDGQVIECTPVWNDGVQETKFGARNWKKYGKLPWIDYDVSNAGLNREMMQVRLDAANDLLTSILNDINTVRSMLYDIKSME